MAKKKTEEKTVHRPADPNVMGLRGTVVEQPITRTLDENYMPYAMSVIVSRAIPEIDGFKPSHRKLLYTMYKMGLLTGGRTKSANIVGQTMRLNPHGDQAIYETMVRLAKGNESLLHPFVDSKGNFGKVYSRDMAYAASRYTEAKLAPICAELFRDLDCDAVDFVDNYDNTTKEPTLLPTTYPNVLVSANQGIAVGMASQICGFNLAEVCDTTIALLKNPDHDIASTLLAPDFPTGGQLVCDPAELAEIYRTGRGGVKVRARWRYDKKENLIEIFEIPYSTSIEVILDKVAELVKAGKVKEISDMRDESDLSGLKLTIDLKRGVDPEKLMQKLYKLTPLQDTFSCNFNILIAGMPRVLGVKALLEEWIAWRTECVRRRVYFILSRKKEKLHLLLGLKRILLDIDKAIAKAGGHSAADGESGAGAAVHGAQGADLPHVPAAAQGHPLHAGRGGHDPEAQIPAATSLHAGGVRYRESPPLSGPQHPRYRRSPAAGGPGRGAADPVVRKKEEPMKRNVLTQYLIITASCALYAVGFNWMFDPNHISVGGFTGLGQIINYLLPGLPIGTIVIILNVPLFVLGWRFIGKDFLFSSIYATAVSSLMIDGLAAVHTFKPMEPILACLYGGVIIGVSCGIMLREGATTGGTELAARLLKLKLESLSIGTLCLAIDILVTVTYALIFRDLTRALYGMISLSLISVSIDKVVYGPNAAKVAYIISDCHEELTRRLLARSRGR